MYDVTVLLLPFLSVIVFSQTYLYIYIHICLATVGFMLLLLSVFKSFYLHETFHETFHEIVLALLPVESKTNLLYVNINFTGTLFFGFDRYCGKVVPEPAVSHPFWVAALIKNVLSAFSSRWNLVDDSRNKRVPAFFLCFIGFETLNFCIFFIKMSCFGSNLFFYK